jgi:glycerophosphoryl diester phosphodiesterase
MRRFNRAARSRECDIMLKDRGLQFGQAMLFLLLGIGAAGVHADATDSGGGEPFHIQSHRGAGIAAPENTLEAFTLSWNMGVTPEADLRLTKDGVIVCFHDGNLKRVVSNATEAEKSLSIEKIDLARVRELEVGSFRGEQFRGQKVPTLADVFAAMRGQSDRLLYLDIKTVDLDQLVDLIREFGVERQVIFTSEKYPLIQAWKKKLPESLTLIWNRGSEAELEAKFATLRATDFAGITHLQIHVFVHDLDSDEPFRASSKYLQEIGNELTSKGIVFQVLPWECADREAYVRLLELGVKSFATDYPEVTLEAVSEFRTKSASRTNSN